MSNTNWESQLNAIEKNTYLDFFKKVDADNKGIVLHDEAMDFLKRSDIPQNILTQFWNATDNENKGFLTEQEFCTIMKLIACAQHGVMTGDPILSTIVPLPEFNGTGAPINNSNANTRRPPMPLPPQAQQQSQQQFPPQQTPLATGNNSTDLVSPEDRQKYIGLFNSFGPENSILSGERARNAFVQSNLPPATLQTIWNLADTRKSGSLNQTEFIIAMFYIERAMKGLNQFPPSLPASVYASATGRPAASPLVRNNTLQINSPPPVPMRSPVFKGRTVAPAFNMSPEEYHKYKTFFQQLDTDNSGFVSGSDAVVFFRHSKLPESDLARIWDLADTNSTGQLNEQEFATAMHMINRRVAGGEIPSTLPAFNTDMSDFNAPQQPQQQVQPQQDNIDLLGLNSDFTGTPISAPTAHQAPAPQQQQQQQNIDLARSQSTLLQSNITSESNRANAAQQQFGVESQAVQELLKQIEKQKELLTKMKAEAEAAEKQLELEKKRKEELTQELQMYRQETKHFTTRAENTQEEIKKVKSEIQDLEKGKGNAAARSPVVTTNPTAMSPSTSHYDFFTLSSTASPAAGGGGLFAKVNESNSNASTAPSSGLFAKVNESSNSPTPSSGLFAKVNEATSPVSAHSTGKKTFDPFAGFKASSSAGASPKVSMNKLKEEKEQEEQQKKAAAAAAASISTSNSASNLDISDIESKFPDLSTMEQNFAVPTTPSSPPPTSSSAPPPAVAPSPSTSSSNKLFNKPQATSISTTKGDAAKPKNPSVSKYGFDLSAFETNTSSPVGTDKDELTSLFSSPPTTTAQLPQQKTGGFDDIFGSGNDGSNNNTKVQPPPASSNSFEDIFFSK